LSIENRDLPVVCGASDAIVLCDVSTRRIVKANDAFGTLLGREPADVIGRAFAELWESGSAGGSQGQELPSKDLPCGLRTRVRHQNGSLIDVHLFAGEVEVDGRPTMVTVVHDARKSHDAEPSTHDDSDRASADERVRELDKLQALGRLAGSIAHDFNNLLSIIVGCVEALERTLPQDARQREITGELASASERATTLIRQLVAFSRRQTLDLRVVNLNNVLRSMDRMLSRLLGHGIRLVLQLDADLPPVRTDIGQIEQVVMNLCTNARDAIAMGGEIMVATQAVTVDPADAGRNGYPPAGPWACLSVIDHGRGMEPEVLSRAFEPFFTTKEVGSGMGLGLATVHGIVTQSAGHVSIDSAPGMGTVVRVWLPTVQAANEPEGMVG
jgi:PAS domain S-box-containing protein